MKNNNHFAEVIESALHYFLAQSWQWDVTPLFGSLIVAQTGTRTIFGLVHQVQTGSADSTHQPIAYQKTEEELKQKNIPYSKGSFPFRASGRARAAMDIDGFIKVLADKETDEILGVHMIGARAADMIAEAVVAMEFRSSAEDIFRISHAHPTFTEAFREACMLASEGRTIHL